MAKRSTSKPKIIVAPTQAQLARKFRPYAVELGYLLYSWNRLQEVFGRLFWDLTGISNGRLPLAIWYAVPSDRTQREMLRAAIHAHPARLKDHPRARDDLIWMINRANSLADQRNDAVHAPLIFNTDARGTKLRSAYLAGHPRALKLKDKNLMVEFRWYADSADVLSRFGERAHYCLLQNGAAWPDRPKMPHLDLPLQKQQA